MNKLLTLAAAVILGFTLQVNDAEAARRLGGGGSSGMQRQAAPPAKSAQQATPAQPAAAAAAQPKRSWMGPLAGLAAGLGLAALASHLGFGEGLANFMMIALLALAVVAAVSFFIRRKAGAQAQGMQYAAAGAGAGAGPGSKAPPTEFLRAGSSAAVASATTGSTPFAASSGGHSSSAIGNIPGDFDTESFVRNAKLNFIRLQAANDAGMLDDIREFTTPEMFAEIKLAIDERQGATQETDVVDLSAQVIDVADEGKRYIVSVHFSGLIREDRRAPAESFSEIWHMMKPTDGNRGWIIAGIQQVS